MSSSNLEQGIDELVEQFLSVYEAGLSSLPTSIVSRKLETANAIAGSKRRILSRTLSTVTKPLEDVPKNIFRGWLLSEGCPRLPSAGVRESTDHRDSLGSDATPASTAGPVWQHASGHQERRWRKLSFTIVDDGHLMAIFHEIMDLSTGPRSLGRIMHHRSMIPQGKLHTLDTHGQVETWPLSQSDVIASLRTTAISFTVESDECDCREITLALDHHSASLIASVIKDHIPNRKCGHQDLHEPASPSVAFSARHTNHITREDARSFISAVPIDAQRSTRMHNGVNHELESPIQELLRKVDQMQEQMHELKSAVVPVSTPLHACDVCQLMRMPMIATANGRHCNHLSLHPSSYQGQIKVVIW